MAANCRGKVIFFGADRGASDHRHAPGAGPPHGLRRRWPRGRRRRQGREHKVALSRRADHAQRHHRLPGRKRDGRRRRRVGRGHQLGRDPPRPASFANDSDNAPGRFNVFDYRGATVIADYGHNPDAILALVQAVETHAGQAPLGGDQRRRRPARPGHPQQTEILGRAFDDVMLYEDACQRGRVDGEVVALLRQGLKARRAPRTSTRSAASSWPSTRALDSPAGRRPVR